MGSIPIDLTSHEKRKLAMWSSSDKFDSKISRNSKIILGIANGKTIAKTSKELDISRPTVMKILHRFSVFRLDGIIHDAPRTGREPKIQEALGKDLLSLPLVETPPNGNRWTVQDIAKECNLNVTTTYRFLKLKGVSLKDPRTLQHALDDTDPSISDIVGLFLSPALSAMAFSCEVGGDSTLPSLPIRMTVTPNENVQAFFSRESETFFEVVDSIIGELLSKKMKTTHKSDFSFFLKLLDESVEECRRILVITNDLKKIMGKRTALRLERRSRFLVVDTSGPDELLDVIRYKLRSVQEESRKRIALQIEHLVVNLTEWNRSPRKFTDVCAIRYPMGLWSR